MSQSKLMVASGIKVGDSVEYNRINLENAGNLTGKRFSPVYEIRQCYMMIQFRVGEGWLKATSSTTILAVSVSLPTRPLPGVVVKHKSGISIG